MEYPESARNVTGTHEKRRRWRRAVSVLACAVVFCTTYALILPAITLSAEPKCGLEEHTHTEDCYETRLVCGQAEDPETDPAPAEAPETDPAGSQEAAGPAHVHTDACYEQVLTCEKPEHTHTDACWSDPAAAEDPKDWEPQDLTGDWNRDTLAIALAQEGYRPSEDYFTVDDTGEHIGYTRYGDWSGDPFGEWNLSFAAFCLHFAGAAEEAFPAETSAEAWRTALDALDLYQPLEGAIPGDLIFLDSDGDGAADRVGIFTGWQEAEPEDGAASAQPEQRFAVMEGNLDGEAAQAHYDPEDAALLGRASPDEAADAWYLCGEKAHIHGEDCYDETGTLTCGKTEHIHSENCQFPESRSFTYEDEALSLTVTVLTPAPLPEGTELTVTEASEATLQEAETYADENDAALLAARRLTLQQGDEPIDTTDFRMTAEVQVREELLDQLREQAATFAADAPETETEAVITLSALQPQEEDLAQQASVQVESEKIPPLTLTLQSDEVVVMASSDTNPTFTVQYYAELPMLADSGGSTSLMVFDTPNGKLPENHSQKELEQNSRANLDGNVRKNLYLTGSGSYQVLTTQQLRKLYRTAELEFSTHPDLAHVDKLSASDSNYQLKEVWVWQNSGTAPEEATSTSNEGWKKYDSTVKFTNNPNGGDTNTIVITGNTVLRLIYRTTSGEYTNPATFYDYDITNGSLNSKEQGINSVDNYSGSGEKFAFGNANCGTGMNGYKHGKIYMNQYCIDTNKEHKGYYTIQNKIPGTNTADAGEVNYGCNFGLVTGLDANGKLLYASDVEHPNLFNDGSAEGKYTYEGSGLTFKREGDIYTLSSATLNDKGTKTSIANLDRFNNPSNGGTTYYHIFTNNFWPMDEVKNKDPKFGGDDRPTVSGNTVLPPSDDGTNHNSFFGMQFALQFKLTKDYTGPLEYLFFGDDDMWVFLDGKLICDIGGVHSSVGEYVDLWDYLKQGVAGSHTLTFFYTERGASGSTCYMRFILPSVSEIPVQQVGGLRIEKQVEGLSGDLKRDFNFTINLNKADGSAESNQYAYTKYEANDKVVTTGTIGNGGKFTLKSGQYLKIYGLPYGSQYVITETKVDGYTTTNVVNGVVSDTGNAAGAFIQGATNTVLFLNAVTPVDLDIQKAASEDETRPLAGAQFELSQNGKTLSFTKNSDGSYTVENADYPHLVNGEEYYITLGSDDNWVIGQKTDSNFYDAQLQQKTGAAAQKVRVYRQNDGSYSFQSVANDRWLDLDEGDISKLVHFWTNADTPTSHVNQKWYLINNGDGTYSLKPKVAVINGNDVVVDVKGAQKADGTPLMIYGRKSTNDASSWNQQWRLIPVSRETTQTLEVSSDGKLHIDGLIPGTYTLTETHAPNDYLGLNGTVTITVDQSGNITVVSAPQDPNGKPMAKVDGGNLGLLTVLNNPNTVDLTLIKQVVGSNTTEKFPFTITYTPHGAEEAETVTANLANDDSHCIKSIAYGTEVTITETAHAGFSVTYKDGTVVKVHGDTYTFKITQDVTITAVNSTGYELPSTGGGGTAWFTLAGLLLMTGAAALTILRRRAKEGGPE